jgi:hypothetical protein
VYSVHLPSHSYIKYNFKMEGAFMKKYEWTIEVGHTAS